MDPLNKKYQRDFWGLRLDKSRLRRLYPKGISSLAQRCGAGLRRLMAPQNDSTFF